MEFKNILGGKINSIRSELKLNQEEFCINLNIDINRASLSKIEAGKQMPSAEFIKSIIETYEISPYWLLDIEEDHNSNDLVDKYNRLSNTDKITLDNYIDFLLKQNEKNSYVSKNTEKEEKKSS